MRISPGSWPSPGMRPAKNTTNPVTNRTPPRIINHRPMSSMCDSSRLSCSSDRHTANAGHFGVNDLAHMVGKLGPQDLQRLRADDLVHHAAVLEDEQGRNAHDLVALGGDRVFVH